MTPTTTPAPAKPEDPFAAEVKALSSIVKHLSAMDEQTRHRVMAYLVARFAKAEG